MSFSYKQVLQILFPPSADERILAAANPQLFLQHSAARHGNITALLPYHIPAVRAAIHLAKFHHHTEANALLGRALADYLKKYPQHIIVPIPLSTKRYHERGYNQVVEIIKAAKKYNSHLAYTEKILLRSRHTTAQTELHKTERLRNLTDAFSCALSAVPADIHTRNIILLDDVTTTGTTMKAAEAILKKVGAKSITCVALAH